MNQQQFDAFKAEMRQIIETRIERPLSNMSQCLGRIKQTQRELDAKLDAIGSQVGLVEHRLEQQSGRFTPIEAKQKEHDNRFEELNKKIEALGDTMNGEFASLTRKVNGIGDRLEKMEASSTKSAGP